MPPSLEQVMTMRLYRAKDALSLASTQGGAQRIVAPLTGGYLSSPDFHADFVPGGSDWVRFNPESGTAYLDARVQFRGTAKRSRTQARAAGVAEPNGDAVCFYVHLTGIVRMDEKIGKVMEWGPQARTTESRDHYHFSHPVFEVSREEDKWMEQTSFVAHGHYVVEHHDDGSQQQAVEFEVYKLVTG